MRDPEAARRWLDQAGDDLRWAQHLAKEGAFNIACFLSQQAAEKALKGLLIHLGEDLVLGHAVQGLCERAAELMPAVAPHCVHWAYLDTFYLATRYPDALPGGIPARAYDKSAATAAVGLSQEVVDFVHAHLTGG